MKMIKSMMTMPMPTPMNVTFTSEFVISSLICHTEV